MTDDAIFINEAAAAFACLRLKTVRKVERVCTRPYMRRGQLLGWRVFVQGLATPRYGNGTRALTETELEALV